MVDYRERMEMAEKELLKRYIGKTDLPKSAAEVIRQNKDLKMSDAIIREVKGISPKDYFMSLGILSVEKSAEEKINEAVAILKERYIDKGKKELSVSALEKGNADIRISYIGDLIRKTYKVSPSDYFTKLGVLYESDEEKLEYILIINLLVNIL